LFSVDQHKKQLYFQRPFAFSISNVILMLHYAALGVFVDLASITAAFDAAIMLHYFEFPICT
jgi:hypothetical protein